MIVRYFATQSGREPVREYVDGLDKRERALALAAIGHLEEVGFAGLDVKPIHGKLWEFRVSQQRVFYVVLAGSEVVLLHAYKKQSQKAPKTEIETADRRMKAVLDGVGRTP